jgi:hypothetical protein
MCGVRNWIPCSLLVVLTALAAGGAFVGAKAQRGEPTHRDILSTLYTPTGTLTTITTSVPTTLPLQAGYRGIEKFCAVAPLTGTIRYDGTSGALTGVLTVNVGGLPTDDEVFVNWSNNYVRAPVIAGFQTDSSGKALQSSVDVGRLAEVRGVEIVLSAASVPNPALGRLEPC